MSSKWKVLLILVFVAVISTILIFNYSFDHWADDNVSVKHETIKSNLDDEFRVTFETRNFPDLDTSVTVTDISGKEEITYFVVEGELPKSELITIADTPTIRSYQYYNQLIYRVDNSPFKGVAIDSIAETEPKEFPELIKVTKVLVANKEWKWIKACGSFLIKAGDGDMKKTLARYATGRFSQEEIVINKNSEIAKESMKTFAKQALEQKQENS